MEITNEFNDVKRIFLDSLNKAESHLTLKFRQLDVFPPQIDLPSEFNANHQKSLLKEFFPNDADFIINIKRPVVYFFEIKDDFVSDDELINFLQGLSSRKHNRQIRLPYTLPQIAKTHKSITIKKEGNRILYVGSRNQYFYTRLMQHLGYCKPETQGLNLCKWDMKLNHLVINYALLETDDSMAVNLVESAMHKKLLPLIGASPSYG
jgi:hypothetical protein